MSDKKPQTVVGATKLEAYLVQYVDGEGKDQVRVALKVLNTDSVFLLQEKINGTQVAVNTSGWFQKAFNQKVKQEAPKVESV